MKLVDTLLGPHCLTAFGKVSHDIHLIFLLVGQFCSYCFLLLYILYSQRNLILWDGAAFVLENKLLWKYLAGNCRHFSRNIIVLSYLNCRGQFWCWSWSFDCLSSSSKVNCLEKVKCNKSHFNTNLHLPHVHSALVRHSKLWLIFWICATVSTGCHIIPVLITLLLLEQKR